MSSFLLMLVMVSSATLLLVSGPSLALAGSPQYCHWLGLGWFQFHHLSRSSPIPTPSFFPSCLISFPMSSSLSLLCILLTNVLIVHHSLSGPPSPVSIPTLCFMLYHPCCPLSLPWPSLSTIRSTTLLLLPLTFNFTVLSFPLNFPISSFSL